MTPRPGSGQAERLAFNAGGNRREVQRSAYAMPTEGAPPSRHDTRAASGAVHHDTGAEPRDWAFVWTLVFTAVLFLRPQDVFPPLAALHLAELSAVAGLVSLVAGRLASRQSITRMTPEFVGVLALGAIILATAPFSIWFGGAVSLFTDRYVKVMLVYLLAVNVLTSPKRIERLTWLLVLSIGYIGFRAVLDYSRGVNLIARGTRVRGSVGGLVENPNDLALHMVIFLPFALYIALRPGPLWKRAAAVVAGVFMICAAIVSGSRGGFLGLAATILVIAIFAIRQRPGLVIAGALAAMCALPLVPSYTWHRLASITDSSKDDYQTGTARKDLMRDAVQAFIENPVTGVGAGLFQAWKPEREQAWHETHNVWLQVASELGIAGLLVFGFLMARAVTGVWGARALLARVRAAAYAARRGKTSMKTASAPVISEYDGLLLDAHSGAMAASLVGFFVCSFFASVAYSWTFYYLLALAVAPRDFLRTRVPAAVRRAATIRGAVARPSFRLGARGVRA